ncbi:MAG: ATP synthase subunit delta [Candidatus Scalindua arabica]|uniref:ATP synthase subunit delta n=1 Tax=Candidatus Scalindua arabica TaxID=1127984 RepID=A0A941W750_9BACT|nr:ATP synthase subunit delta [Candidatus Scalindua arabica]
MIEESLATGYAQALFEVAEKRGGAEDIEKDLDGIKDLLGTNKKFRDILYHPSITRTEKKEIIGKIIAPQCSSKWVKNLLFILVDKRREKALDFLPDVFKGVARQIKGVVSVKVQTVFPLTESRLDKLKGNLEKMTKKTVELETEINKEIIGGMIIRIENKIIDGSVVNHLKNLKKNLLKTALA